MPYKKPKRHQVQDLPAETLGRRGRKLVLRGLLAIATFLGYIVLIPRVTVDVSDPVDPNDPFSSSVTVRNTGFIPIRSVYHAIAINEITVKVGGGIKGTPGYGGALLPADGQDQSLEMDDQLSFPLSDTIRSDKNNLVSADIAINVGYTIPIIHIEQDKWFPVEARRQPNGNFYWYAKATQKVDAHQLYYKIGKPLYLHTDPASPQENPK